MLYEVITGEIRKQATAQGWLDQARPLPSEAELAEAFAQRTQQAGNGSSVAPYRAQIQAWVAEGIDGTTIHRALVRNHGFTGSYSAVRRFLQSLPNDQAKATVILDFAPGEAAQVDFGSGPRITSYNVCYTKLLRIDRQMKKAIIEIYHVC